MNCPVCTHSISESSKRTNTPYWVCSYCNCWFQNPAPPKTYEGPHELKNGESSGHLMSQSDKDANANLASLLFNNWMKSIPGKTLDIGAKYPYLAHCLKHNHGCDSYANDAIESVDDYGNELDVPMIAADIETVSGWDDIKGEKYDLITMVHVFEHMHDPYLILERIRDIISERGILYLRMPDHNVPGYERDLTENHYTIHPFFHTLSSVLELLVHLNGLFTVAETYPVEPGQRDYLLRPAHGAPRIAVGMIAKNEERDLPRCLKSIEKITDEFVFIDTGSTDNTLSVVNDSKIQNIQIQVYTGSSTQDEKGNWQLWNFGDAKNRFVDTIDNLDNINWLLWVDADDELIHPEVIRRYSYLEQYKVYEVFVESGGDRWTHHRMWRTNENIRFVGACHEYPSHGSHPSTILPTCYIKHDSAPHGNENSNARNLRILMKDWDNGNKSSRNAFYIAQTHRDGGRYAEAIQFYDIRISMGIMGHIDEYLFSILYKGRCQRAGKLDGAKRTLMQGMIEAPNWSEFPAELMYIADEEGNQNAAIGYAHLAINNVIPPSTLWRERNKYTDQPARTLARIYNAQGKTDTAIKWALKAKELIGTTDLDWEKYILSLQKKKMDEVFPKPKTITVKDRPVIVLFRQGAIGDILMTLNMIPKLRKKYPNYDIHYSCNENNRQNLQFLFDELNIKTGETKGKVERYFNLIGYPLSEGYPNLPMKKHLIEYFAKEMGLEYDNIPLILNRPANPVRKKYVTLQTQAGWSVYKQWDNIRWEEIVYYIRNEYGYEVYQIGGKSDKTPIMVNAYALGNMKECVALLANAECHLGIDSFANHLTNYVWENNDSNGDSFHQTRGIILFGSTQYDASGYLTNINLNTNLPCQPCFKENPLLSTHPKGACDNPPGQVYEEPRHECMNQITVNMVKDAIDQMLRD